MIDIFSFLDGISPWWWVAAALALGAVELVTFSYFLLWLALAAASVAGTLWVMPGFSGTAQVATFAILALIYTVLGWKLVGRHSQGEEAAGLNNRARALIGRSAIVMDAFRGDTGAVEVDGIRWRGRIAGGGPAPQPGAELVVTDAAGMTLILSDPAHPAT
ncbi:NfeD family protein [Rhodobacteraceae bacterium NNCM2]|nr:NfeD family protein [Coraliihabitans acroporae]